MKIETGVLVRHVNKPEWGVGKVEGINGENVFVRFTDQLKTLKMSFAEKLLEPAGADAFMFNKPAARGGPAVGRLTLCGVCGKTLDKSRRSFDGAWKACVRCSTNDGTEHIFYPYPGGFSDTDPHASEDDSASIGSDCLWCRSDSIAPVGTARHCGGLEPAKA